MLFLFSLIFYESQCDFDIENDLGANFYRQPLDEGEKICMKIKHYPSFVVFENFTEDTKFEIITHKPIETSEETRKSAYIRYLLTYIQILDPFVQIVFHAESPVNLSFSVLSLPGMCADGLFFLTKANDELTFSSEEKEIHNLAPFSDKCSI